MPEMSFPPVGRAVRVFVRNFITGGFLVLFSAMATVHADPQGQTYFEAGVMPDTWSLVPPVKEHNDYHHKFGAAFWRGQVVLVSGATHPDYGAAYIRVMTLEADKLTPLPGPRLGEANLSKLGRDGHMEHGPAYGPLRTDPLVICQVFQDQLYVFYYDRNCIRYNVYTPPAKSDVIEGGTWSQMRTVSVTGLSERLSGPYQVDDIAVSEVIRVDDEGNGTPEMVLAVSYNQDPTNTTRRVVRFYRTTDGQNWTAGFSRSIDTADGKGNFKFRCIDIDMAPVVDENGVLIAAFSAVVRGDNGAATPDSQALVGLYDGEGLKNLTDIRKQFDSPTYMPFRMRLYWGTIGESQASFKGRPLSAARNVLQVFMLENPGPSAAQALYRAEVFLGEPGYRAENRPLTLLALAGRPRGQDVVRESPFVATPSPWNRDEHIIPSLYKRFYQGFASGFDPGPQKVSYDYNDAAFDVIPVALETRDPGAEISRYQQYALVLGYRGLSTRAVRNYGVFTGLAYKSDQLVPYGYVKDQSGDAQEVKLRTSTSTAAESNADYSSWQLIGILTGPPPYADDLRQAGITNTAVTSRVEFSQTAVNVLQTTAETSSTTSASAGFAISAAKLDLSWKQTAFRSDAEKRTFTASYSNALVASPNLSQSRGRMIFLVPTIRVQTYYQSAWDGERINYRHVFGSEPSTPIAFLTTSIVSMDLKGVDYDMENPDAPDTPFAHGSMRFPASNDLVRWSFQSDWNYAGPDSTYIRAKASDINALFTQYTNEPATVKLETQSSNIVKTSSTVEIDAKLGLFGKATFAKGGKNVHTVETTTTNTFALTLSQTAPAVNVPASPRLVKSWSVKPYFVQPAPIPNSTNRYANPAFLPTAYRNKNQAPFLLTYRVNEITYNTPAAARFGEIAAAAAIDAEEPAGNVFVEVPQSATVAYGGSVQLTGRFLPEEGVTYQWYRRFEPIPGATSPTLELENVTFDDEGSYHLTATDASGEEHSSTAAFVDVVALPVITLHPASDKSETFDSQVFVVEAVGAESYQWRINGEPVEGATSDTFEVNTSTAHVGEPLVIDVVVSNVAGSVVSEPAFLTVFEPLHLWDSPVELSLQAGGMASFSISGEVGHPATFLWYIGDDLVAETTGPRLSTVVPASWNGKWLSVVAVGGEHYEWDLAHVAWINIEVPLVEQIPAEVKFRKLQRPGKTKYIARAAKLAGLKYQWFVGRKRLRNRMDGVSGATASRVRINDRGNQWKGVLKVRVKDSDGNHRVLVAKRLR